MSDNKHKGSSFESFLKEEGILDECTATAKARVVEMEREDMGDLRKAMEVETIGMVNGDIVATLQGALKEALAQPEQEPVAWVITSDPSDDFSEPRVSFHTEKPDCSAFPLYTKPQPLRRLSDEEAGKIADSFVIEDTEFDLIGYAKAIQDAIEKLNNPPEPIELEDIHGKL